VVHDNLYLYLLLLVCIKIISNTQYPACPITEMWYIMHHNGISNFKAAYNIMQSSITCTPHQYYSDDHIRSMRWMGHVACTGERRGAYRVLLGKPDGKRPLGRLRQR